VDDALPSGATPSADGGDSWTWVSTPAPYSGAVAHQSSLSSGLHEHWFDNATGTLDVGAGDTLFAYVYLDPLNLPSEVMLMWNDGSWEHRAYWGANLITYGVDGTAGRRNLGPLPSAGAWVRLEASAAAVGLEGRTLKGMAFSLSGGRATWDAAGKTSTSAPTNTPLPTVSVTATDANASRVGPDNGVFTMTRTGSLASALAVNYTLGGAAVDGIDYNTLAMSVTIPAGAVSVTLVVVPKSSLTVVGSETVVLTLSANAAYSVGSPNNATLTIAGNIIPCSVSKVPGNNFRITWASTPGKVYRVAYKNSMTDAHWTDLSGNITASTTTTSWTDTTSGASKQRYYTVYVVN